MVEYRGISETYLAWVRLSHFLLTVATHEQQHQKILTLLGLVHLQRYMANITACLRRTGRVCALNCSLQAAHAPHF